jgi:hypothetical protein
MALDTSFLLLEADWPVRHARHLLEGMAPRWIVVHGVYNSEHLYYTFGRSQAELGLSASDELSIREAFSLHQIDAAPTSASEVAGGDQTIVVVSRGLVRGVVTSRAAHITPAPEIDSAKLLPDRPSSEIVDDHTEAISEIATGKPMPDLAPYWLPEEARARGTRFLAPEVAQAPSTFGRAIEATAPSEVTLNDTVSLVVKLVTPASHRGTIPVRAADDESLDVVVQTSGGLRVQGKADGALKVAARGTPMLLFKIEGTSIGQGEVSVMAFQRGEGVGSIDLAIRTVKAVSDTRATAQLQAPSAEQPDLMLLVAEPMAGNYTMYLTATDPRLQLNFTPFSFSLEQDPQMFFDAFYSDIEQILTSGATPLQKIQRLGTKGTYLFDRLLSPQARAVLWDVRSRIGSVHIQSQEPWVPWELLKLSGDDGTGTVVEAGFLCEDYEVTRWVPGIGYRPDLTMSNVGVVIPPDSGLPAAVPEREQMLALASPQRKVTAIQPEEVTVRKALADGRFDVIHFTGHGVAGQSSADRAEIRLQGGSRLRPEDLSGVVGNLGKRSPIVFLNACEIGRAGMGLGRPGGWPRGFLAAGAGAFIGPFWKVADPSAATFAAEFYRELIKGKSVGAAARAARLTIKVASDPTWLAYSVYAHCNARLS